MKIRGHFFYLLMFLGSLTCTNRLVAQADLLFGSLNYESPTLVAPIFVYDKPSYAGAKQRFSLVGWTIGANFSKISSPNRERIFAFSVTPLNAHGSNQIYQNGEKNDSLYYQNATFQLKQGFRRRHNDYWTSEWYLIELYEWVKSHPDETINQFWKKPFIGFEIKQSFRRQVSNDIYQNRGDGFLASGQFQFFTGWQTWWQINLQLAYDKKIGRLFFRNKVDGFYGSNLNTVNQFLIGGHWDLQGLRTFSGAQFAEHRLNEGFLASAGIDYRLIGDFEVSFRSSYIFSDELQRVGIGGKVSITWQGVSLNFGVGYPVWDNSAGGKKAPIIYARISFGLLGLMNSRGHK